MNSDERSLTTDLTARRDSGYMPLHQPIYYRLHLVRQGAKPQVCTLPTRTTPMALASKKKNRGLKTPRLMLPMLLG